MLSLGLDRSVIGDILVNDKGADMIVNSDIVDFLLSEFHSAGHTNLQITASDIGELEVPEQRVKAVRDTLSSPRLRQCGAAAFHVSRSEAVRAIKGGIVFVNHEEVTKIDKRIDEGDTIVLRGKGKAILSELSGLSKKGRIWAEFKVFNLTEFKVLSSYKIRKSSLHHSSSFASYTSKRKVSRIGAATAP